MKRTPLRPLAVLLAATALAACGGPTPGQAQTSPAPAARPDAAPGMGTIGSAVHPWTEADAQFMTLMIGHHAQALEMSRLAPERAENAAVMRLAERIINGQGDEIASMQLWLRDRGLPVPRATSAAAPMAHGEGHGHAHGHGPGHGHSGMMPGMLTPEQMAALEAARGAAFDRLFLSSMIQHHRGAVSMVRELFASHGAAQDETVFKFASDVNVDQITEIERMQTMLADLTFGSAP